MSETDYKVGTEVEHRFKDKTTVGTWYRGKITEIDEEKATCTVEYESYTENKKLHDHDVEKGIAFDENIRLALTIDDVQNIDEKYGLKVNIIEKNGDLVEGILHKIDKEKKYSFIETSKSEHKGIDDEDTVHVDVEISQVLRYDVSREDLQNKPTVRVLRVAKKFITGQVVELDPEDLTTCTVKLDKTSNKTIGKVKFSELLLYVEVPKYDGNTDELMDDIKKILTNTNDQSIDAAIKNNIERKTQ